MVVIKYTPFTYSISVVPTAVFDNGRSCQLVPSVDVAILDSVGVLAGPKYVVPSHTSPLTSTSAG